MSVERLDTRAIKKVSGPSWTEMRPIFNGVCEALLGVSPDTSGELTTIYVKFAGPETGMRPYAVVWLRKASEITVGLSLPSSVEASQFDEQPDGCKYAGLTRYLVLKPTRRLPESFNEWAKQAYEQAKLGPGSA